MSDMSFEEMMSKFLSEGAKKAPSDPMRSVNDAPSAEDYTTIVYLVNGDVFEHAGTIAMDLGYRVAIPDGIENLTVYNSDHVLYYEVMETSKLGGENA